MSADAVDPAPRVPLSDADAPSAIQRDGGGPDGELPKIKRTACVLCRKRKLRCDGEKPSCGTCVRLQHQCIYDSAHRRKSGPKRGYVKALEARLAQVETLLKHQDDDRPLAPLQRTPGSDMDENTAGVQSDSLQSGFDMNGHSSAQAASSTLETQNSYYTGDFQELPLAEADMPADDAFPWEMIGLGMEEPLPEPAVVAELDELFFRVSHSFGPVVHRARYMAAMLLPPHMRPPVCLRYAMWACAAAISDKYEQLHEHFYLRARKYIQQDEMKGHGESMLTLAHCQTWCLITTYEFKMMLFPRAWMSAGRASVMALMMGLHRIDVEGLAVKQCLAPPVDDTAREERRRTFWLCFCVDRYSSIGTGWPMTLDERDISTLLPSSEEGYNLNKPTPSCSLQEALNPQGVSDISIFAGVVVMACLLGRNITHLHRVGSNDDDNDVNGEFWKRHRAMDNTLSSVCLTLPPSLRLPNGLDNQSIVFMNMSLHTAAICLHQAAISKAEQHRMPPHVSAESKMRCITAAAEIASTMRQISHLDLSSMNPFMAFCLYVAARVFVQWLKRRPNDMQRRASLQFLISAMRATRKKNLITESFLVQLDVDIENAGLADPAELCVDTGQFHTRTKNLFGETPKPGQCEPKVMPVFGDQGAASYNNPNARVRPENAYNPDDPISLPQHSFPLPHRMPGSHHSSIVQDMDVSPADSGRFAAPDHVTPNSSTQNGFSSGQTSRTGYTAENVSRPQYSFDSRGSLPSHSSPNTLDPSLLGGGGSGGGGESRSGSVGNSSAAAAFAGFDLHGYMASAAASGAGLTPSTPGLVGPSGASLADIMGMSEADWSQVLDISDFQTWPADPPTSMMADRPV